MKKFIYLAASLGITFFSFLATHTDAQEVVQSMDTIDVTDYAIRPGQTPYVNFAGVGGGLVSVPEPIDQVGRQNAKPDLCAKIQAVLAQSGCNSSKATNPPNGAADIFPIIRNAPTFSYFPVWQADIVNFGTNLFASGAGFDIDSSAANALVSALGRCKTSNVSDVRICQEQVEQFFGINILSGALIPQGLNDALNALRGNGPKLDGSTAGLIVNKFVNGQYCAAVHAQSARNLCP